MWAGELIRKPRFFDTLWAALSFGAVAMPAGRVPAQESRSKHRRYESGCGPFDKVGVMGWLYGTGRAVANVQDVILLPLTET